MVYKHEGPFLFNKSTLEGWASSCIGVYYCGYIGANGAFCTLYVGRSVSEEGIRGRLLQHHGERKWPRVTHFVYKQCTSALEAMSFEAAEIPRLQPAYNTVGK